MRVSIGVQAYLRCSVNIMGPGRSGYPGPRAGDPRYFRCEPPDDDWSEPSRSLCSFRTRYVDLDS